MTTQGTQKLRVFTAFLVGCLIILAFAMKTTSASAIATDAVITGKIKVRLSLNAITRSQQISVDTNNGVVTLKGKTDSVTEATQAIEIAESTVGVTKVDVNQLYVTDSNRPLTDAYVTAKIKGTFLRNDLTPGEQNVPLVNVKVETQNGVVYLAGSVANDEQRAKLIQLAKSVDGVINVKSALEINKA